jgi:5-methylcytosine-specific restriction endonuclease McrA
MEFTRKTKRFIFDRANGCCEKCKAVLKTGEGEVDHILPCELGGEPTPANGRLLCRVCHREKTANDIRRIRSSDRQRDKASGVIRAAGKIKSQGFAKAPRPDRPMKKANPPAQLYAPIQETRR